ncbi:helix-turn-helix transcriptional regulator [uncultured Robinsoniella sp.]|uniref:helix-turn-helix transcriptional regulator n=1 Tax=uncultured Robinsoniella sp. TaxID=904190 RepID=UPI00374E7E5A
MSVKTVKNMIAWVEANIKGNPTLEGMSCHVGYSAFYCSAKFHEYTGVSFKKYIASRKLCLAAEAIAGTDQKFLDIAVDYGYSSQEAFTRAFVKQFGRTPGQYRRYGMKEADITDGSRKGSKIC